MTLNQNGFTWLLVSSLKISAFHHKHLAGLQMFNTWLTSAIEVLALQRVNIFPFSFRTCWHMDLLSKQRIIRRVYHLHCFVPNNLSSQTSPHRRCSIDAVMYISRSASRMKLFKFYLLFRDTKDGEKLDCKRLKAMYPSCLQLQFVNRTHWTIRIQKKRNQWYENEQINMEKLLQIKLVIH